MLVINQWKQRRNPERPKVGASKTPIKPKVRKAQAGMTEARELETLTKPKERKIGATLSQRREATRSRSAKVKEGNGQLEQWQGRKSYDQAKDELMKNSTIQGKGTRT